MVLVMSSRRWWSLVAEWLGFVDNAMVERPLRGKRSVESVVSHLPATRGALARAAYELEARASARLEILPRRRTGASQVGVEKRDLDYIVFLHDSESGKGGAAGIEVTHNILGGAVAGMGG